MFRRGAGMWHRLRVSRRRQVIITIIAAIMCGIAGYHFTAPRGVFEVTYHGRDLAGWRDVWLHTRTPESLDAIRVICSNRLPELVAATDYEPYARYNLLNTRLSWLPAAPRERFILTVLKDQHLRHLEIACGAFIALGPEAAGAIPGLENLSRSTNDLIAMEAFQNLLHLGANGAASMVAALDDTNDQRRWNALKSVTYVNAAERTNLYNAGALPALARAVQSNKRRLVTPAMYGIARMAQDPDASVAAILPGMQNSDARVRNEAIGLLSRYFNTQARAAVPAVLKACDDPDLQVRKSATNFLRDVVPETLTNAPAKKLGEF